MYRFHKTPCLYSTCTLYIYRSDSYFVCVHYAKFAKEQILEGPQLQKVSVSFQKTSARVCISSVLCIAIYKVKSLFQSSTNGFNPIEKCVLWPSFSPTIETHIQKNDWKETQTRGSYDLCCNLTLPLGG